ncbi:MAG: hypothetical protein NC397_09655 [Clostridium sp.]|nr:hypothetical protein [Clostridium sp.]
MYYYNQMDYDSIAYDNKSTSKKETVKTSGCGVCAACIAFNNLCNKELYSVKKMAEFSVSNGARDNSGTNMETLIKALCKKNPDFKYSTTTSEDALVKHLKAGGMAICNQGDSYNVFSTAGHFVVAYKMSGSNIEVLDPQMYSGKYDSYSRPDRIVKKTTNGCIVTPTEMGKATADRNPAYFLITYNKPKEDDKVEYKYFTPNAAMKAKSKVYADSSRKTEIGSVSKKERVKVLFKGETNACIQYGLDKTKYKVGLVYSKDVEKD